ncbi:MAG TPA: hypothetical protein VHC69_13235 [Polyangiaceae bacterium]|nr:hypothetical protein [Polyangiaceae bacterium]
MTDRNDNDDREASLASLFDRTARTPSDEERTKLVRRARDVGSAKHRFGAKTSALWAPAAAAAAAALYLAMPARHASKVESDATSSSAVATSEARATGSAAPAQVATQGEDSTETDDPAFAVLVGEPSDMEPFDLGPLMDGSEDRPHGSKMERKALPERQVERNAQ